LRDDPAIKAGANDVTQRVSVGGSVILSKEGYDVEGIRKLINTVIKTKTGNPELLIIIDSVPAGDPDLDEEDADFSALGLDGYKFKGKAG
jgi:hypothetical protein